MEVVFPHKVEYLVGGPVPVDEIIGTLQAQQRLVAELAGLIEGVVDGVRIQKVELRVRSIDSGSLKEAFFVALFLTYQSHLEQEIPAMLESWTGLPVDDRYDTIVTVGVLLLLFYGADYAYTRLVDQLGTDYGACSSIWKIRNRGARGS